MNRIMSALRSVLILGLAVALALSAAAAAGAANPRDAVEKFYSTLLGTMKEAGKLGYNGRYQRLAPVVQEVFDTQTMTRTAVGARWSSLDEAQRKELTEAFTRFIAATYANRFDGYANEQFVVKNARELPDGATVVETQMLRQNEEPINFNYVLRQTDGNWRIGDILFGAVSELANRRAEFSSVIRRDGVSGLITELNRKVKDLETP
jgi:phospholipid transport system substrate-binding protein